MDWAALAAAAAMAFAAWCLWPKQRVHTVTRYSHEAFEGLNESQRLALENIARRWRAQNERDAAR